MLGYNLGYARYFHRNFFHSSVHESSHQVALIYGHCKGIPSLCPFVEPDRSITYLQEPAAVFILNPFVSAHILRRYFSKNSVTIIPLSREAQISGGRFPGRLSFFFFLRWRLNFKVPQDAAFFCYHPKAPRILRWLLNFWKLCGPHLYQNFFAFVKWPFTCTSACHTFIHSVVYLTTGP